MRKPDIMRVRDRLTVTILKQAKGGPRMQVASREAFLHIVKKQIESRPKEAVERLEQVGLKGFLEGATAAEEMKSMRVLYTYLTRLMDNMDADITW